VIRPFQLREINIVAWNVLNRGIDGFAEREGVPRIRNHTARGGHDDTSGVAFDGNRMIWTWKLDLLFVHVFESPFEANLSSGQVRDALRNPPPRAPFKPRRSSRRLAAVVT
jgi:hypothetical protein